MLAGFSRAGAQHTQGSLVLCHCSCTLRVQLLATDKEDLRSQIYRYTDKLDLRGTLRRELGTVPKDDAFQLPWKHMESPSKKKLSAVTLT